MTKIRIETSKGTTWFEYEEWLYEQRWKAQKFGDALPAFLKMNTLPAVIYPKNYTYEQWMAYHRRQKLMGIFAEGMTKLVEQCTNTNWCQFLTKKEQDE